MKTLTTFSLAIFFVTLMSPPSCIAQSQETKDAPRHIKLEGQSNFRDVGGYRTKDGKVVKSKTIYRSGELPNLTDQDLDTLSGLKIRTVVNFLTDQEIEAHGGDRLPSGVRSINRPIDSDVGDLAQTILQARKDADFSKVPPELNPQIHRLLIDDKTARVEYANLLRLAANPENRPLVFHCSHGIHRTGTGTAILLWSLGVPWETIREDYLLSNKYREEEIKKRLDYFRNAAAKKQGVSPEVVDMTNFESFYILKGDYIDAARDQIVKKYGGIEGYLKDGLKLTKAEIGRLREQLLEEPAR